MDLAQKVAAALQASILPSVIARGGELKVLAVENGVAILEVGGSPGASLPLIARIEALIRGAVPEVTSVRMLGPGFQSPGLQSVEAGPKADLAELVRGILEAEINPIVSAHRGRVTLVEIAQGWVRLRLEGGCQGCSLAEVTVRQGIEPLLRARVPGVVGIADITDHQAGREPFFSAAKR